MRIVPIRNPDTHVRVLLLLVLVCALASCDDDGSDADAAWKPPLYAAENAASKRQFDAAARHYRAALAALERSPDRDELSRGGDFARTAGGLARVYAYRGEIAKAESLFQRLLTIQTASLDRHGTSGQPLATTLASLADLSLARKDYERSATLYERILSMQAEGQIALEPDDQLLAYTYGGLGKTHAARGDSALADSLTALSMSLRLYSEAFEQYVHLPDWVDTTGIDVQSTNLELIQSFEEAESAYRRAIDFQTAHLGHVSPHVARCYHGLAWLLEHQRRHDEALILYRDAARILAQTGDSLDRAAVLEDLASLLRARGEHAVADSASAEAEAARRGAGES